MARHQYTTRDDAHRAASDMLERSEYRGSDLQRAEDALTALLWRHRGGCTCDSGPDGCMLAEGNETEFWRWLSARAVGSGTAWLYGPDEDEEDEDEEDADKQGRNDFHLLTATERDELADAIAGGRGVIGGDGRDDFRTELASGRTVSGAYRWESELGEFIRLEIEEESGEDGADLCPMCSAHGIDTPSETGPEAMAASIDVGNTEPITGVLCRACREAGIEDDGR